MGLKTWSSEQSIRLRGCRRSPYILLWTGVGGKICWVTLELVRSGRNEKKNEPRGKNRRAPNDGKLDN